MLEKLFELQREQQNSWYDLESLSDSERDQYLEKLCLYMIDELVQFLHTRGYKTHKIWDESYPKRDQLLELIDVQKYLLIAAMALGADAKQWIELFEEKTSIVAERLKDDRLEFNNADPIVCCDIDDVLADYDSYVRYGIAAGNPDIKRSIEERGLYRKLSPLYSNINALQFLRRQHYRIVLMTSRRNWRVQTITADTTWWLNYYQIPYDTILFGYDKAEMITRRFGSRMPNFAVENSRKHAIDIAEMGVKVYFILNGNAPLDYPGVVNIHNLLEIEELNGVQRSGSGVS